MVTTCRIDWPNSAGGSREAASAWYDATKTNISLELSGASTNCLMAPAYNCRDGAGPDGCTPGEDA